jgi:ribosome-associated translation inhibitor RaiA
MMEMRKKNMKINLINGDFEIKEDEKTIIKDRLHLALGRFSSRIADVTVKLSDDAANGKGLKKCRIEVLLRPIRTLVAEDAAEDLRIAIDRAAALIAGTVERKLERERRNGK